MTDMTSGYRSNDGVMGLARRAVQEVAATLAAVFEGREARATERRATGGLGYDELRRLDDRMLKDLGLYRDQIGR
ncbi:MAG: DUF1127 domain-containing protein [Pseudomonadota bacterium]